MKENNKPVNYDELTAFRVIKVIYYGFLSLYFIAIGSIVYSENVPYSSYDYYSKKMIEYGSGWDGLIWYEILWLGGGYFIVTIIRNALHYIFFAKKIPFLYK